MNTRNNIPLFVGLALPLLMILFVAGSIYLPRMGESVSPQYDFLYMTQGNANSPVPEKYYYAVDNGKITRQEVAWGQENYNPSFPKQTGRPIDTMALHIYDTKQDTIREISFEDAEKLALDPRMISSDGFEITQQHGNGGIFTDIFGGNRDYGAWYIAGHGAGSKLNLENKVGEYYYGNFRFLGWIIQK